MRNLHPPYDLTLFPQKLIAISCMWFSGKLKFVTNKYYNETNFPILSSIFGRFYQNMGCYTMDNFVIPKTGMLHQWPFYIKRKIPLYESFSKNVDFWCYRVLTRNILNICCFLLFSYLCIHVSIHIKLFPFDIVHFLKSSNTLTL